MKVSWIPVFLLSAACLPGWGQSQPQGRFTLTARLVARTLSDRGIQTADEQVSLPARVVATEPYPKLDILSVEPLGDELSAEHSTARSMVKLTCDLPGTCLPFYAIATWPEGTTPPTIASEASPVVRDARVKTNSEITMRVGTHASLVMDDHRSHIQVAVISLENGVAGKWIRVASPDRKQVYVGEVVSANELRGNF
jgi:hypothetical protein